MGTETTFPVTATSEIAPITYALSGTVPTDVTIHADTGTLTIPASLAAGDYTFTITATNEDGATNQTFTLYMRPESAEVPTITTEPASASYVRGIQ
ncbi:MAG: putative Ig domain-containing protein [Christensenellaceae bacterium]